MVPPCPATRPTLKSALISARSTAHYAADLDSLIDNGPMGSNAEQPDSVDNRWLAWRTRRAMHRGVRLVIEDLAPQGVIRAIPFLGYHLEPVVWLITKTDADRDGVGGRAGIPQTLVIERLREAGVRADLAARAGVTVESEETVNRDHAGDWRVAMQ